MNKTRKTYGIKGFMEYQAVIKVGRSRMKVPFENGSVNAMGVNPATFTTDRFMVQHAIENSAEFKRGLIYTVSSIPLDGKVEIERPGTGASGLQTGKPADPAAGPTPATENGEQPAGEPAASGNGTESKPEEEVWPGGSAEPDAPLTPVEFASNDEAKDYLEQRFGLVRSKLRNREEICNAGKANGVEIIFV